jgi:tRNA 5-methylaminomethyl-2-thiouridine biosynthesis bifunctional protein
VLDWQDGQPVSRRFGDVYFSRAGGLEEARHVFLAGNRLAQRFAALPAGATFVVGETGFGTGLNFLAAWHLFASTAPREARLHFVSTELYPLPVEDLDRALRLWPELDTLRDALLAQYGAPTHGWHRCAFDGGQVHLTLLVGDARDTLPALRGSVDAWFLDGFSPARNPELWEEDLLQTIGARSRPGATAATYSCAGHVRRGLAAAGFRVRKAPGFGSKREMLCAQRDGEAGFPQPRERRAIVIGGGLAGASVSDSLARRGWRITLVERGAEVAAGASGNPQGVLYARLSAHATPLSRLVLAGYQHTLRVLRTRLPCDGEAWSASPVLQLAFDADEAARQAAVLSSGLGGALLAAVSATEASEAAGLPLECGGIVFPAGGWVHPPALCRTLLAHASVEVRACRGVELHGAAGDWEVRDGAGPVACAPVAIIAAGADSAGFPQTAALPLRVNRGQLTLLPQTAHSARLRAVLCGEGYAAPARSGWHCVGATFAREASAALRQADHAGNLAMLQRLSPALFDALGAPSAAQEALAGRAGLRCVSPDYLPCVGPVGTHAHGLFVSTAHGSRGLITAPLAGEVLAACLETEPAPLPDAMMQALHPQRFA